MSLKDEIKKLKFDKRMTNIYLNSGKLTAEELKQYQESLPDLGSQALPLDLVNSDSSDDGNDFGIMEQPASQEGNGGISPNPYSSGSDVNSHEH